MVYAAMQMVNRILRSGVRQFRAMHYCIAIIEEYGNYCIFIVDAASCGGRIVVEETSGPG